MKVYDEDDFLMISGLQHFMFCRRQWALIHIEQQWAENYRTADGEVMHRKVHDSGFNESRGNRLIIRAMRVCSRELGLSGECDAVEFTADRDGVELQGREGRWLPCPVEYKRGSPKEDECDIMQLCAQGMCLEEMLCCSVEAGYIFYGETRRRLRVGFDEGLRQRVREAAAEMHGYYERQYTPRVRRTKACSACSLKDICLPGLMKSRSAREYMEAAFGEGSEAE